MNSMLPDQKSKFIENAKRYTFKVLHAQLDAMNFDRRLVCFLLIIQTLQIINTTIHQQFTFLWKTPFTTYIQYALMNLSFQKIIQQGGQYLYVFLVSLSLLIFIVITLCIAIILLENDEENKNTSIKVYSIKILNILIFLMETILTIPILQVLLITFSNDPKYGLNKLNISIYYCCITSASFSLFFLLIYSIFYSLFFIQISPFKQNSLAVPYNNNQLYKFIIKLLNSIYLIVDNNKMFAKYYIIFVLAASIFWCFKEFKVLSLYNFPQNHIYDSTCICLLWFSLCVFLQAFISPQQSLGLYFTIVGLPIIIVVWLNIKKLKQIDIMCTTFKTINKHEDIEFYILTLVNYVKKIQNTQQRIKLQGILNYHILNCKKTIENCNCSKLNDYQSRFKSNDQQFMWYYFIKQLLNDSIQRFPRASRLYIITSYIQHQKLNNKYKALYNLVRANQAKPSLVQQFLGFHSKQSIQQKMIQEDKRLNQRKSVDINKFLNFSNKLLSFRQILQKSVNIYIQFWNSLIQQTPNLQKIKQLGSKITNNLQESKDLFEKLCTINSSNIQCLSLYGNFLKQVVNDMPGYEKVNESIKITKKNLNLNKNFTDEQKLKYGQNSQTGIIIISGNFNNLGIIQNCNTQVKNIIGYYMSDLIGQNISRIMPKTIGDYHDQVLKNYLQTSQEKFNTKQRFAPMIDKDGFLVPCTIMTKSLPSLQDGIKLVGFFKIINIQNPQIKNQNPYYVFFKEQNEEVQGLSRNIFQTYNIKKVKNPTTNQINNQITIKSLFGWSFQDQKQEQIKDLCNLGYNTQIISMNQMTEEIFRNKGITYKKHNIILFQKILLRYQGSNLKLLYFYQLPDFQKGNAGKPRLSTIYRQVQKQEMNSYSNNQVQNVNISQKLPIQLTGIQVQMNQEAKLLKQFKTLVGQKNQPRSIKALKRTGSLSFLFIIIMAIIDLVLYNQRISQINEGNTGLYLTNTIISDISQINYYTRKMHILSYYQNPVDQIIYRFNQFTSNITNLLYDVQNHLFNLVKLQITANSHGAQTTINTIQWKISQNGTIMSPSTTLDLCLFDYITSASGLQTTSILGLNFPLNLYNNIGSYPSQAYINLFNVRYSGLYSLIPDFQKNSYKLMDFYYYYINSGQNSYFITLMVAMALIIIAELIAIPFIFSVVKINNTVLSLFGYIHAQQVQELIYKCTLYLDEYLEDTPTGKIRMRRQQRNTMNITKNSDNLRQSCADEVQINIADDQLKKLSTAKKIDQQNQLQRCQILMKSKDSSNIKILLQYSFFSLVFGTYFMQDYLTFSTFLGNSQSYFNVSSNLYKNINQIKKIKTYTLETIVDNSTFQNYTNLYDITYNNTNFFYMIQRKLVANKISQFDPVFTNYFYYKDAFNQNDICSYIDNFKSISQIYPSSAFTPQQCYSLGNNILGLGLRPAIVGYIETAKQIILINTTKNSINATVNSQKFKTLQKFQKYIQNPSLILLETFNQNFNHYLNLNKSITVTKFTIFILIILFLFLFAWMPFLSSLNMKIWMTKGMLNMIPMQLVNKNQKLKQQFISGSIFNSVK